MKRSSVVTFLLFVLALFIAACGANPTAAPANTSAPTSAATSAATRAATTAAANTTAPSGATTAPTTSAAATTAPAATSGNFKLNTSVSGNVEFWHHWGSQLRRTSIRRVIGICQQKLPNVKVTDVFKPFGDGWTANAAAVAAGSGMPDVIVSDRPTLPQAAADKVYESLAARVQKDGVDGSAFFPFTWQQTLYNNESYGMPFETDVRVLYWDKNLFREVGLDPEKPPVKWDDLFAMADKLDKKNPDGSYARIAFLPVGVGNIGPDMWMYTDGATWVQNGKVTVDQAKAVEVYEFIKKWSDRYGGWDNVQKFISTLGAPPNDAFMSGKVAMIADIQGYVSQIRFYDPRIKTKDAQGKDLNDRLDYGVSDLPYNVSKGTWSGGFSLSVPRGAKNPDAAWEFIKCATSVDGEASWSRDTNAIAPNIQANKDPSLVADPVYQSFVSALQFSKVEPFIKEYPNWGEKIFSNTFLDPVLKGQKPIKDALTEAQKAIDEQIAKKK